MWYSWSKNFLIFVCLWDLDSRVWNSVMLPRYLLFLVTHEREREIEGIWGTKPPPKKRGFFCESCSIICWMLATSINFGLPIYAIFYYDVATFIITLTEKRKKKKNCCYFTWFNCVSPQFFLWACNLHCSLHVYGGDSQSSQVLLYFTKVSTTSNYHCWPC